MIATMRPFQGRRNRATSGSPNRTNLGRFRSGGRWGDRVVGDTLCFRGQGKNYRVIAVGYEPAGSESYRCPGLDDVGELSPSANPGLHRYRHPDVPGPVPVPGRPPLLIQAPGFGERPIIVPHEVFASTLVGSGSSRRNRLSGSSGAILYPFRNRSGSKGSPRFRSAQMTTRSLAASFTCILRRIPRSWARPRRSRL